MSCSRTQCNDAGDNLVVIQMDDTVLILKSKVYIASTLISAGEYQLNILCKLVIEIQTSYFTE